MLLTRRITTSNKENNETEVCIKHGVMGVSPEIGLEKVPPPPARTREHEPRQLEGSRPKALRRSSRSGNGRKILGDCVEN